MTARSAATEVCHAYCQDLTSRRRLAHRRGSAWLGELHCGITPGQLETLASTSRALRDEARALVRRLASLNGTDPAALRTELDARENLERQLGLNVSLLSDLQSAIVVLGPLLAAAVAVLLPTK